MEYQSLTRKQLQALCKKHGVPANLSSSEMADRLSSILKGSQKITSQGESFGGNSRKKGKGNDSLPKTTKVVKKVRFSPENETFVYDVSGYKRGGRRRCTVKSVSETQIQATENDVVSSLPLGRKRAKRDVESQDAAKDEGSKMLSGKRITRSQTKLSGEACGSRNSDLEVASDFEAIQDTSKVFEIVKNVAVPGGPSRGTRRNTVMFTSTVSADVESETQQNIGQKAAFFTNRSSRRNVLDGAANSAQPDKVLQQTKPKVTKAQHSEISSGNPRRLRSINEIIKTRTNTLGKASAAESGTEEENVQLEEHSKGLVRHNSRGRSVVSQKGKVGSDGLQEREENRKLSRNNDLKGVSELEAFVEPNKEFEMMHNVFVPTGPSRRTRRNAVMLKSSNSANELSENYQTSRQKDISLTKNLRKSSRIASRAISTVTSSKADGKADDVGKVGQQKRRQEPILDEDGSLSERKPLTKRPLKRSARIASKMGFVEPAEPTNKAVRKKQNGRLKMPIKEQKALYSGNLSASEHGRLAVAANYKNKVDGSYSKQVLQSSKKKREANGGEVGANKPHGSFEPSTVNSATEVVADTTLNLEETSISTLVKLPCVSSPSNRSDDSAEPLNFVDLERVNRAEEPSLGNNMNHWSDNVDDQSKEDDRVSVQEYRNLELGQAKTEDNATTDRIENEEASCSERAYQVVSEKITNGGYEGNLLVGHSAIPISVEIGGKDTKKKEVSQLYIQDTREKENKVSEQRAHNVSKETGGDCMVELQDAAVSSSELVSEKIYDGTELVRGRNCSVDISAEDVSPNEDYAASKRIDGKSLNGEADVEQCADVAKEENLECALKVELQDKSDQKVVAPHMNVTAGTSLTEFISKESEVSDEKVVETTMNPVTCIEGVDNIKVEGSKFEDRNSDTEVIDDGPLAQVSDTCLVQDEALEECNVFIQNERTEGDREAQSVAMKRKDFLDKAGNVDALVAVSLATPGKTCADELAEINDRAAIAFNKVIAADVEDHGERSNEFMGFVPQVDEVNFGDLVSCLKENVSDLERSASATSDNLLTTNSRAVEKSAGGTPEANSITQDWKQALQVKENLSTAELFDQQIAVNHVDKQEHHTHQAVSDEPICDNETLLQKNELSALREEHIDCEIQKDECYASAELLLTDAAASSGSHIAELNGFKREYVSDDLKDVENIVVGSGSNQSGSRGNSTDQLLLAQVVKVQQKNQMNLQGQCFSRYSQVALDGNDMTLLFLEETEVTIGKSKPVDGFNPDSNARDSQEVVKDQMDKHESAAKEATFRDGICCSGLNQPLWGNKSKGPGVEAEEADGLHHLDDNVGTAEDFTKVTDSETSNVVSTSIAKTAGDCPATSPVTCSSNPQNKAIELNAESLLFTDRKVSSFWGPNEKCEVEYSAGALETTFKREDASDVKDDVMIMEQVAAQINEEQFSEHKTAEEALEPENMLVTVHGTSGERICDSKELDPEKELSAFNLEHIDCEIQQDTSYVSAEVLLIEASEASSSPFADLDGVDHPKNAENITVDAGVFSCCGSRRISMDKVHKGANKTMNTQEVENVGTGQPVTPEKTCAGFENPEETSHDISGRVLQQLFSSGSRWKESFCKEMNNGDVLNGDYISDAGRTEMADQDIGGFSPVLDARDFWEAVKDQLDDHWVKDNVLIMEQEAAQITEEQIPENITAEDVSELDPNLCSDTHAPSCKGSEGETEQQNTLSIIHGTFENTNPTACTDTAAQDPWKLEINLLSPRPTSSEATTGRGNTLFAKKLKSSMRKQNKKSASIQRTPKPLIRDMKENLLSTKREKISNMTAEKTLSKRRALEDLRNE
ncbi:hypothetical protein CUMW_047000 [Citrus unshiu]|nr:hypothetical protein CUMW_047000 [Citrus unshiu]